MIIIQGPQCGKSKATSLIGQSLSPPSGSTSLSLSSDTSSSLSFAIIVIIMFMVILKVELPGTRAGPPWLPPCQHCPSRASHSSLSSGDNHHHHHVHDEDGNDESPLMIKRMEHGTESVDSCSLSLHHPSSHQLLLA